VAGVAAPKTATRATMAAAVEPTMRLLRFERADMAEP